MSNEQGCQCGKAHGACNTEFQYAVKVICGEVSSQEGSIPPVAPGRYCTAINIHNPEKCKEAHFRWKVAIATPGEPGPVYSYSRTLALRPDVALEIDCPQILQAIPPPAPKFVKGYVVIASDTDLDVVAVYSGTPASCGPGSLHMERVQPRCVPVCEDLVLPLNTGLASWQLVSPTVGPVAIVNPTASGWAPPSFGSSWVSQASTDGTGATTITRTYELCFDLCFGYQTPAPFPIQLFSDGPAQVFLNGHPVGNVASWSSPTTLTVNPAFLQAGRNCFRVAVVNGGTSPNPTGFAMAGILNVIQGKCPCSPLPIVAHPPGPAGSEIPGGEPSVSA